MPCISEGEIWVSCVPQACCCVATRKQHACGPHAMQCCSIVVRAAIFLTYDV